MTDSAMDFVSLLRSIQPQLNANAAQQQVQQAQQNQQVQALQQLQQQQQLANNPLQQLLQSPLLGGQNSQARALIMLQLLSQQQQQQQMFAQQQQQPQQQSPVAPQKRAVKTPKRRSIKQEETKSFEPALKTELGALKLNLDHQNENQQPLSSLTSIDEGVVTSSNSPTETVSCTASPAHSDVSDEDGLPKESDHAHRKRPAAIQDMLKKKARLNGVMDGLYQKKEFPANESHPDEPPCPENNTTTVRPNSLPSTAAVPHQPGWSHMFGCNRDEDTETTSSTESSTEKRRIKSEEPIADNMTEIFSNLNHALNIDESALMIDDSGHDLMLTPNVKKQIDMYGAQDFPAGWNPTNGEVYESPNSKSVPHDQLFAQVPGRLSLLSNVVKYKMTVAEVRRRVLGPECFNFSLLGALLRRAKMPEKSQALFGELRAVGLAIPRGRRRAEKVNLLSALTEAESEQLVIDFGKVSEQHFPVAEFAAMAHVRRQTKIDQLHMRMAELEVTKRSINEFIELLRMDRSEIRDLKPDPVLPANIQDPLSTFSMMTHGFGTPGLMVGVQMFGTFLDKQMDMVKAELSSFVVGGTGSNVQ